jgi:hypothetical protein
MKPLVQLICGLVMLLAIAAGLRYVFGIVQKGLSGHGVRGMVLWEDDWNKAITEASTRHKKVLVEFARESSQSCQDLAKKGWSRMDIVSATSDYVPVMVDMDEHAELARQFAIATVPSLVVIDPDTQSVIRDGRDQTFTPDELLVWLKPDARTNWDLATPPSFTLDPQKNVMGQQGNAFSP